VNSNLIRVPFTAGVRTLLCNVDINKIILLRTMHMTVEMLKKEAQDFIPPTLWPQTVWTLIQ